MNEQRPDRPSSGVDPVEIPALEPAVSGGSNCANCLAARQSVAAGFHALSQDSVEAAAMLSAAMEAMAQGIVIIDENFKIVALNEQVWEFVPDYRNLYQIGGDIRDAWLANAKSGLYENNAEDSEEIVERWTQIFKSREALHVERGTSDGRIIRVDLLPSLSYSGWITTYTDITEAKKAEATLLQSEQNLRTILENVADGLFAVDQAGVVRVFNTKAEQIFGYSASEVIGNNASRLLPASDGTESVSFIRQYLRSAEEGIIGSGREAVGRRKDGSEFPLELGVGYVQLGEDHLFLASVSDITGKKAAEKRLQHGQRLESLGQLVGGIAHEFNNLLTSISGFTEMALKKADNKDLVVEFLTEVSDVTKRAVTLTGQMLAFGRKQIVEKEVVKAGEVLHSQESLIRVSLDASTELTFEVAEDDNCIEVDPGQLSQCVMNLVANARQAMPDGGQLSVSYQPVELTEDRVTSHGNTLPAGSYAVISVTDSGAGMEPEVLARLFDPFFTTKERGKGTGLGLSLVYGMTNSASGVVDVESKPGVGSTFSIYLPIVDPALAEVEASDDSPVAVEIAPNVPTILIADDDAHVRRFAEVTLIDEGYHVLVAKDGAEAMKIHKSLDVEIDLLLTDVVMPRVGGVELAEKARSVQPDLKVVYMSGYTAQTSDQISEFAVDGNFLQKPFQSEDLIVLIKNMIGPAMPENMSTDDAGPPIPGPSAGAA